jgi:2'-5' RNA ligase
VKNREQGKRELSGNANLRLFFALWLDPPERRILHKLAGRQQLTCGGRIMREETIHMTLLFLGETPAERLPDLDQAASRVRTPRFNLVLDRFAGWRHNGIGYAAPSLMPDELASLVSQLHRCVAEAGFSFDRRAFVPHVTLLRKVQAEVAPREIPTLIWPVREFVLVQSVPEAAGVRYEVLSRWPLLNR